VRAGEAECLDARERPRIRERARELGVERLGDEELLALLVERGVVGEPLEPRVARLLREAGGLDGLASLGVSALAEDHGLGLARGARIAAAIELGLRVARHAKERSGIVASSSEDVERWGRARLAHLAHEELWALLLDARNRLVAERMIARGGLHACATTPRDVLRPVVREATHAFVLVHNHPGGDPCPSREDAFFTRRVAEAAEVLGVALVDHVIVARDGYVSMLESGMLDEPRGSTRAHDRVTGA
jgi:DNA repair protein RadC